jgi:hypothetical protein
MIGARSINKKGSYYQSITLLSLYQLPFPTKDAAIMR